MQSENAKDNTSKSISPGKTVQEEGIEIESYKYYTNMMSDGETCTEEGDYASISTAPRYSLRALNKLSSVSHSQENIITTEFEENDHPTSSPTTLSPPSVTADESQDQHTADPEGIYDEPGELVDYICLLYTSPSPRDATLSRMPSSA